MSGVSSDAMIEFDHVSFTYAGQEQAVLSDVSWSIPRQTWCSLLGPNGVGKSTVLKLIAGELTPVSGKIIRHFDFSHMVFMPQYQPFYQTSALVCDVIRVVEASVNKHRHVSWISHAEWEKIFGIADIRNRNISHLSVGQRQRLVIGLYLLKPAEIIVLDEPTSGCDVNNANMIYELLESIRRNLGITIVHVSHEIHQVMSFAKEVICIGPDMHIHRHVGDLSRLELEHAYGCELHKLVEFHSRKEETS